MATKLNLMGETFGRLTVSYEAERKGKYERMWHCSCECGNTKVVSQGHLRSGHTQSCGCLHKETMRNKLTTHGLRDSKAYSCWANAKQRCTNPNNDRYENYMGRGITMYPEWLNSFEAFYRDMGDCPEGMSLDRYPDNDGNYEPDNCRWATQEEQQNNKRNNHLLTFQGRTQTIQQWSRETGIHPGTIYNRVVLLGWSDAEALTTNPILGRARAA